MITPTTIMVVGPTGSGKTEVVMKMLTRDGDFFDTPVSRVRYHYGAWQEKFERIAGSDERYTFIEGLPSEEDLPSDGEHTVMVIDDLMEAASKSKTAADIFTKHSHHKNITVIIILQKLYGNSHIYRVITGNAHVLVLFKNPRNASEIRRLAPQMFPSDPEFLVSAYTEATKKPFSYLVVNAHQQTPDRLRVTGNLFTDETPELYMPIRGQM